MTENWVVATSRQLCATSRQMASNGVRRRERATCFEFPFDDPRRNVKLVEAWRKGPTKIREALEPRSARLRATSAPACRRHWRYGLEESAEAPHQFPEVPNGLFASRGQRRSAAAFATSRARNERRRREAIHVFDQLPGVAVAHAHRLGRGDDRPVAPDSLEQHDATPREVRLAVLLEPDAPGHPVASGGLPLRQCRFSPMRSFGLQCSSHGPRTVALGAPPRIPLVGWRCSRIDTATLFP